MMIALTHLGCFLLGWIIGSMVQHRRTQVEDRRMGEEFARWLIRQEDECQK